MATKPLTKTITVKLPVGRQFQESFDTNVEKLRNAVVPILATRKDKPVTVGSAVLIRLYDRRFIVTALHVLLDNKAAPLFVFDDKSELVPIEGEFLTEKAYDLAALLLSDAQGPNFASKQFLATSDIRQSSHPGKQYATIVGYPSTKTKILKGNFIDTEMYSMADFVREEEGGRLWVKFDKRRVTFQQPRRWITAPDPYGMSGGAIFAAPVSSIMTAHAAGVKLAGIATHWRYRRRMFEGTSAETVRAFLEAI